MFTIHPVKNGYIVKDEFGKKVGWFQEKYYADLFVSFVNTAAQQKRAGDGDTSRRNKFSFSGIRVLSSRP